MMPESALDLVIQAGALGLLALVIVLIVVHILPEERKARRENTDMFIHAMEQNMAMIERHEESHRVEISNILAAHQAAVEKMATDGNARLQLLNEVRTEMRVHTREMKAQTALIADFIGKMST